MTTRRTVLTAMAGALVLGGAAYGAAETDAVTSMLHHRQPPSPETLRHLLDGRIAMIKTSLQLTPDQEKLWAPVEQVMRDNAAGRAKHMAERLAERAKGDAGAEARLDPVARLEFISKQATERAAGAQKMADALKPLYATLNDEQKAVAMLILEHKGGRGEHGGGWGHGMRG